MKKVLKITAIMLLALLLLGAGGFVLWAETPARPRQAALAALQSDDKVTVTETGKHITFEPSNVQPSTGFIFYPGGRVDYRAYAPILRQIAEQGYFVALVPVRLNLAFFDVNAAEPVLADFPQIEHWAIGGHSLGGVAASLFAGTHPQIEGIVYWASYPADDQLKNSGIKMMSIYASNDGLATGEKIEASKANLPTDTLFLAIQGGNHAQFGDYGPQGGDNLASIPAESQWQQVAKQTAAFLKSLAP
ncbi:MAG: alpha/beta hydrolase [Chloroflexi bacterium]|nr:MAG: alpha/beta hydrolase [Chloroflexota bacterium]